jgi:hypothetical protein
MAGITALSSEAVGVKLGGYCKENDARGCYMGVAIFSVLARVVEGLLCLGLAMLAGLVFAMWRWESGAVTAPGSIVSVGMLMQDEELREALKGINVDRGSELVSRKEIMKKLDGHRYFPGWDSSHGARKYGIVARRIKTKVLTPTSSSNLIARTGKMISTAREGCNIPKPSWVGTY